MLIKQLDHGGGDNVRFGDSFTDDQFVGERSSRDCAVCVQCAKGAAAAST